MFVDEVPLVAENVVGNVAVAVKSCKHSNPVALKSFPKITEAGIVIFVFIIPEKEYVPVEAIPSFIPATFIPLQVVPP